MPQGLLTMWEFDAISLRTVECVPCLDGAHVRLLLLLLVLRASHTSDAERERPDWSVKGTGVLLALLISSFHPCLYGSHVTLPRWLGVSEGGITNKEPKLIILWLGAVDSAWSPRALAPWSHRAPASWSPGGQEPLQPRGLDLEPYRCLRK